MAKPTKRPTKACTHPKSEHKIIAGGLHRCEVCKAIRGVDNVWRLDGKPCGS